MFRRFPHRLPAAVALPFAALALGSLLLAWSYSQSDLAIDRAAAPDLLQVSASLGAIAVIAFLLACSRLRTPRLHFSTRDLLLVTAAIAVTLSLLLTIRRAQQKHHDLLTCGPNTLQPSSLPKHHVAN